MSQHWLEYVKTCYDLVVESEGVSEVILDHDVEAYVVHLMANNFERTDIGTQAVAIKILEGLQSGRKETLRSVGDECLLIHSYPFKQQRWPSPTYYQDIGITAYGLANHVMEQHFVPASRILNGIFRRVAK